jgi:hypothetical protein
LQQSPLNAQIQGRSGLLRVVCQLNAEVRRSGLLCTVCQLNAEVRWSGLL